MKVKMMLKEYSLKNNFDGSRYFNYMGMLLGNGTAKTTDYVDIEVFFLWLTTQFGNSRTAEGALCWIRKYGHLLSPSKIRRLVRLNAQHNQQVLNGIVHFMKSNKIKSNQFQILRTPKFQTVLDYGQGVRVRNPMPEFAKENVLLPQFSLDENKFLMDEKSVFTNNIEMRSRVLFGSCVNADVYSIIKKDMSVTGYQIHKLTSHHKSSINNVYQNICLVALAS